MRAIRPEGGKKLHRIFDCLVMYAFETSLSGVGSQTGGRMLAIVENSKMC